MSCCRLLACVACFLLRVALGDVAHADALQLSWEPPDALAALVEGERIDVLLLSDVAYPSKDSPAPLP